MADESWWDWFYRKVYEPVAGLFASPPVEAEGGGAVHGHELEERNGNNQSTPRESPTPSPSPPPPRESSTPSPPRSPQRDSPSYPRPPPSPPRSPPGKCGKPCDCPVCGDFSNPDWCYDCHPHRLGSPPLPRPPSPPMRRSPHHDHSLTYPVQPRHSHARFNSSRILSPHQSRPPDPLYEPHQSPPPNHSRPRHRSPPSHQSHHTHQYPPPNQSYSPPPSNQSRRPRRSSPPRQSPPPRRPRRPPHWSHPDAKPILPAQTHTVTKEGGRFNRRSTAGYELQIKPNSLQPGGNFDLSIQPYVNNPITPRIPEDRELGSGVVYLEPSDETELTEDGSLTLQHCVDISDGGQDGVNVVTSNGRDLYRDVPAHQVQVNSSSVVVHFRKMMSSFYVVVYVKMYRNLVDYCGMLYRWQKEGGMTTSLKFYFIVVKDLNVCIRAVEIEKERCPEEHCCNQPSQRDCPHNFTPASKTLEPLLVKFAPAPEGEDAKLMLDLEEEGITDNGWNIRPATVEIPEIDAYNYLPNNRRLPLCEFEAIWKKLQAKPRSKPGRLNKHVHLKGTKIPKSLLVRYDPQHPSVTIDDRSPDQDQVPTLKEAVKFEGERQRVYNIPKEVGTKFREFAAFLLEDQRQRKIHDIVKDCPRDIAWINREILTRWLQGKGRKPVAWATLIAVLRNAQMHAIADCMTQELGQREENQDQVPTMQEVDQLRCKGRECNILEEVGSKYKEFGTFLLEDHNGSQLKEIERDRECDCAWINSKILSRWLQGEGRKPVTWATLIGVLRAISLKSLANDMAEKLGEQANNQDQVPVIGEIAMFVGEGQQVHNIPEVIGAQYREFGAFLLEDHEGTQIQEIERDCPDEVMWINHEILTRWLQGKGRKPVTWATLITALRYIQMTSLVDDMMEELEMRATSEDQVPTMEEVLRLMGEPTHTHSIPEQIGTKYKKFCTLLLDDTKGKHIRKIEREHDARRSNYGIVRRWIEGQGRKPVTWATLIAALRHIGMDELGDDMVEELGDRAICEDQVPRVEEIAEFEEKKPICNIPEEIGRRYEDFGTLLLEDHRRIKLQAIEQEAPRDPMWINHEILNRWLQGKGKKPITWATLITALRHIKMESLSDDMVLKLGERAYHLGKTPRITDLYLLENKAKGLKVQIISRIQAYWVELSDHLKLEDETVRNLRATDKLTPEKACRKVFKRWLLKEPGIKPKTWGTLNQVLKEMGQAALAGELDDVLKP